VTAHVADAEDAGPLRDIGTARYAADRGVETPRSSDGFDRRRPTQAADHLAAFEAEQITISVVSN
jgi:hypothetical protein